MTNAMSMLKIEILFSLLSLILLTATGTAAAAAAATSSSSKPTRQEHHHHVFVFRHCIRSVQDQVNLYDGTSYADPSSDASNGQSQGPSKANQVPSNYPTKVSDYLTSSLPNWETGPGWCTVEGLSHAKRVGEYVMKEFLLARNVIGQNQQQQQHQANQQHFLNLEFQIVTDTAQRDSDTALALAEGLARQVDIFNQQQQQQNTNNQHQHATTTITVNGLQNLQYDPMLFHPTSPINDEHLGPAPNNGDASNAQVGDQLCTLVDKNPMDGVTLDTVLHDQLDKRLEQIVSLPEGSKTLGETLQWMQDQLGQGQAQNDLIEICGPNGLNNDHRDQNGNIIKPMLNPNIPELQGGLNVLDKVAEMVFYSRASRIGFGDASTDASDLFWPNATLSNVQELLAWHYYHRNVVSVGNTLSAATGSVWVQRIQQAFLKAIEQETKKRQNDNNDSQTGNGSSNNNNNTHYVTIFLGHDGNLNALATALNATWTLPPPYQQPTDDSTSATISAVRGGTPPASALYFHYQQQEQLASAAAASNGTADDSSNDKHLQMSFLVPPFFNETSDDAILEYNSQVDLESGKLLQVPLRIMGSTSNSAANNATIIDTDDATVTCQNIISATTSENDNTTSSLSPLDWLRCQVTQTLQVEYPQGNFTMDCYAAAQDYYPFPPPPQVTLEPSAYPTQSPIAATTQTTELPTVATTAATNGTLTPTTATALPTTPSQNQQQTRHPTPAPHKKAPAPHLKTSAPHSPAPTPHYHPSSPSKSNSTTPHHPTSPTHSNTTGPHHPTFGGNNSGAGPTESSGNDAKMMFGTVLLAIVVISALVFVARRGLGLGTGDVVRVPRRKRNGYDNPIDHELNFEMI